MPLAKDGKTRQRTLSAASIASKFKWMSSKEATEVIPPVPRLTHPSMNRRESEGLGMWDNNDDAFLKELEMEEQQQAAKKSKRLSVLSFRTSSSSDVKLKQRPKSVLISPRSFDTFGLHSNGPSPTFNSANHRPSATSHKSSSTKRSSISTDISNNSTLITFPSPEMLEKDLDHRRPSKGDDTYTRKRTSMLLRGSKTSVPVSEFQGWTKEPVRNSAGSNARKGSSKVELVERPPRNPGRCTPNDGRSDERMRQASLPRKLDLHDVSVYNEAIVESDVVGNARTRVTSAVTTESAISMRSHSIVYGLKKKFGKGSRFNVDHEENSLGIDFSDAFRRGSAGLTPAIEKIPMVNTVVISTAAPNSFAQYNFPSNRPMPIRRTSSSSRGLVKKIKSQDALKNGSNILKHPSIDSLSSRFLNKHRDSGVSSHSRDSSRHSFIEHTSFDEARSGSFTPTSMTSSYMPDRQRGIKIARNDEEREELHGNPVYYTSTRRDLSPQRGGHLTSPVRPSRFGEESMAQHYDEKRYYNPTFANSGRRGSDGLTGMNKSGQLQTLQKMHSIDGLNVDRYRLSKSTSNSFIPPLPLAPRGSLSSNHQVTHRRSDRSINLSKKQSLRSLHISRPTTVMSDSTSAELFEITSAPAESHELLSPESSSMSNSSSIRRLRGQERRKQAPSPLQAASAQSPPRSPRSPRSVKQNSPRYTRSAGGWIEQGPPTFGTTRSPTSSTFARMQQEHYSQAASKRPTFGIDLQPDAAAAFDCIPSPDASRRVRTKSSPTLSAFLTPIENTEPTSDSLKSETSSPSLREAYTPLSANLELDTEIVHHGATRLSSISRSPSDCRDYSKRGGKDIGAAQSLLLRSPPRPILADAPESPTEEVEVLDDGHDLQNLTVAIDDYEDNLENDDDDDSKTPTSSLERMIFGDGIYESSTPSLSKSRSYDQLKQFGSLLNTATSMNNSSASPIENNEYSQVYASSRRASYTYV